MPIPIEVIRQRWGRVSHRWGEVLFEAGLKPHVMDAALELGMPVRTLMSRLRRGDRGARLKRMRQRRICHAPNKKR